MILSLSCILGAAFGGLVVVSVALVLSSNEYVQMALNGRTTRPTEESRKKKDEEIKLYIEKQDLEDKKNNIVVTTKRKSQLERIRSYRRMSRGQYRVSQESPSV